MTDLVAGHRFVESVFGPICCLGDCTRLLAEIEDATKEHVGKPGISHVGTLNDEELEQIQKEKARRAQLKEELMARCEAATMDLGKR